MPSQALCEAAVRASAMSVTTYADGSRVLTHPNVVVSDADRQRFTHIISSVDFPGFLIVLRDDAQAQGVLVRWDPWQGVRQGAQVAEPMLPAECRTTPGVSPFPAVNLAVRRAFWRFDNPLAWAVVGVPAALVGALVWWSQNR